MGAVESLCSIAYGVGSWLQLGSLYVVLTLVLKHFNPADAQAFAPPTRPSLIEAYVFPFFQKRKIGIGHVRGHGFQVPSNHLLLF